jgi:hypothetical protein
MTYRGHCWRVARFAALGCVYAFGMIVIIASGTTQQVSCPPRTDEQKPLMSVRLVGVTPPVALPGQQVVTIDRHYTEESTKMGPTCSTSKSSRYVPKGGITVVDNEVQFGFGFSPLDLTTYESGSVSSRPLGMSVLVRNGSAKGINIDWNAVTLIDASGRAYGVLHRGVKMADRSSIVAPSTVPPGAVLDDFVYPKELVSFSGGRYGSGWIGIAFFEGMRPPQNFKLYLPIRHGADTVEYQFVFAVGAPES